MDNFFSEKKSNYCGLFDIHLIDDEFNNFVHGFGLVEEDITNDNLTVTFSDKHGGIVLVTILNNEISGTKNTDTYCERIHVGDNQLLTHIRLEKREKGIIVILTRKKFDKSKRFGGETVLTDLVEERFVFTKEKLKKQFGFSDIDSVWPEDILLKLGVSDDFDILKSMADHYNFFSTHMNNYFYILGKRGFKDNIYPTLTHLNDTDLSNYYDIDGPDKLYRVHDLYHGAITPRCENDILDINLGFLPDFIFDLLTSTGIRDIEDGLIGPSVACIDINYLSYLKDFFMRKFKYDGEIGLDRKSLLGIIRQKDKVSTDDSKDISISDVETLGNDECMKNDEVISETKISTNESEDNSDSKNDKPKILRRIFGYFGRK